MRFRLSLVCLALAASGCAGNTQGAQQSKTATSQTTSPGGSTQLTADDIPDVLMPGVWPNSDTWDVERNGDSITVQTDWNRGDRTVDGRDVSDPSQAICAVIPPDLSDFELSVDVLAGDGSTLAHKGAGDDTCHVG